MSRRSFASSSNQALKLVTTILNKKLFPIGLLALVVDPDVARTAAFSAGVNWLHSRNMIPRIRG